MILRKNASRRLREEVVSTRLSCGLEVHVLPKPGFARKTAILAVRYGSVDQAFTAGGPERTETPPGVAHFLEHQLFKKEGGEDALMEFGRYGASSNAFTDYTVTAYYFTASGEFEKSLELLAQFVTRPYFSEENAARERLIIEQELRMSDDSPDYRIFKNLMGILYTVHPVRVDIGGTVESIRRIDAGVLERCYRAFYRPSNMLLLAGGDLDPAGVARKAEALLPPDRFPDAGPVERHVPREPAGVRERVVRQTMAISRPRVLVGFKDLSGDPAQVLERELATVVLLDLLFGRSSDFYRRRYEEGLIDDTFSFSYTDEGTFGFSLIGGETDAPERLAEAVLMELHRARKRGLGERDVERSRRKRLGRFLRSFDSPDGAAFALLGCLTRGIDPWAIPRAISGMTVPRLLRRLEAHFDERNYAVSILLPAAPGGAAAPSGEGG